MYDTLFSNPTDAWYDAFAEIASEQNLPVDGAELWRRWKEYEVNFRRVRTNLDDPAASPPFKTYETAWAECFERVFRDLGVRADAPAASRRSVEHMARRAPFEDTIAALQTLRGAARLAVFSNADDAFLLPMLGRYDLEFEFVASSESARIYKPHPGAFRHILDRLNLPPSRIWYVGDNPFDDVFGAHQAGITTVWINRKEAEFKGQIEPDIQIRSLAQIADHVATVVWADR